jgi:hypothetical protein
MPETNEQRRRRLRWLTFGELLAVAAVAISALGLWKTWNSDHQPTTIVERVEQRQPIALTLRGKVQNDGRNLEIAPVEPGHALQSLVIQLPNKASVEVGSDGQVAANDVEDALGKDANRGKGTHRLWVRIRAKYVEAGETREASGNYALVYRWEGGGLLGGRSLRLTGLSR